MAIPSVTPELINNYTTQFNNFGNTKLKNLWQATHDRADVLPPIQIDTACLIQFLVKLINPRKILELGTGVGVSTLIIAHSVDPKAEITTIERGDRFVVEARQNFETFGMNDMIKLLHGDAAELVGQFDEAEEYDFIFQDSGKQLYLPTLNKLVSLLKPGGLLLVDDTLFPAMELPERNSRSQNVINQFNLAVQEHPLLESFILPVGHGLTIARKVVTIES